MRIGFALLLIFCVVLAWSAIRPHDYFTWLLEVFPALIGIAILLATHKRFPLTPILYTLLCVHAIILMVGGHYTYAEVPAGFWVAKALGMARNDYDRLGHFAQGFVPAIAAREILIRLDVVRKRGWLLLHRRLDLSCDQCRVRAAGVDRRRFQRRPERRIPRHSGRRLGYAERHGHGARRIDRRATHSGALA